MRLLNDMSRCMGELSSESATVSVPCNERETCARWLALGHDVGIISLVRKFKPSNDIVFNEKIEAANV